MRVRFVDDQYVLQRTVEMPGCPCYGDEVMIDGELYTVSLVVWRIIGSQLASTTVHIRKPVS